MLGSNITAISANASANRNKSLILRGSTWRTKAASGKQIGYAHALTKRPTELLNGMSSGQISDLIRSARALLVEPELSGGVGMDISAAGAARTWSARLA